MAKNDSSVYMIKLPEGGSIRTYADLAEHVSRIKASLHVDPVHSQVQFSDVPLIQDVWKSKYAAPGEVSYRQMNERVVKGIYAHEGMGDHSQMALKMLDEGILMPGGRILAGAGTTKRVTLMNCYVNSTVHDSMTGIHDALGNVMFTLQQGGGIGTDFSTLRPRGAMLRRTGEGSAASGPLPFMDTWNATSLTIKSAGDRRGAMMGTISDTHPDLPDFITAKQQKGKLEQFNISVLVSDAFMAAVEDDAEWPLYFSVPPAEPREESLYLQDFVDNEGVQQYVYSVWQARDLWDMITQNTYEFSEPGVIFIDRINGMNNLYYCENIRCTNPCGEQPLPPHGTCNLTAINLARVVRNPFQPNSHIDYTLLQVAIWTAVRFLDNVIEVTAYPLPAQEMEEKTKRRLGLGISGLADMLAMLGIRYGANPQARAVVSEVMRCLRDEAYYASVALARERGAFPAYNEHKFQKSAFIQTLPAQLRDYIWDYGIRNGLLMTIAPTGTTSLIYGNISSGLEPVFLHEMSRRVFGKDGQWKEYGVVPAYGFRIYKAVHGDCAVDELPDYMVTTADLTVNDHLAIQAVCQQYVDASISKTINLPKDIPYKEFKQVYRTAYELGLKGCTTYKPSDIRGEVLSAPKPETSQGAAPSEPAAPVFTPTSESLLPRPERLDGSTYKIRWPSWSSAVYVTINHNELGKPLEVFIHSKDARHQEWITALTIMISALLRQGATPEFIVEELKQVQSTHDTAWVNGKHYGSLVARVGYVIEQHLKGRAEAPAGGDVKVLSEAFAQIHEVAEDLNHRMDFGSTCPQCSAPGMIREEGCLKCISCGYSKCS